jgi:hypothetical protein
MASVWAEDRWQGQFARGKDRLKGDKYKDWTYEKVRDYAANQRLFDGFGFPSVDKAIDAITQQDEMERKIQDARAQGLKEGELKARLGAMPRPASAAGAVKVAEESSVSKNGLEGLSDDVVNDPELAKMLSDLNAMSPEDLIQ